MKRIIFIFHEATITGAPILLYRFLKFLHANNPGWDIKLLFQKDGPLVEQARRLFPVAVLNTVPGIAFPQRLNTWLKKYRNKQKLRLLFSEKVSLVYSNTIANGFLLNEIQHITKAKVLIHVHELPLIIQQFGILNFQYNEKFANAIIFNSKLTAELWPGNKTLPTKIIYPFVEQSKNDNSSYKIAPNDFIIGGCGNFTWRKGIESFIFVAKEIHEIRKNVRFKWVGGDHDSAEFARWHYLIRVLGLQDNFEFFSTTPNPGQIFETFDLLFVSSYEEPFSMVSAECAVLGVPLVCYENCTGAEELFIPEAGITIPPGLHHRAALLMIELLDNEERRLRMSKAAKRIAQEKTSWQNNSKQMLHFISELIN